MKRALFLDRDGVINNDYAYVHKKEDFNFIDGIFELVAKANSSGYMVIIVTNQAGIGRGLYSVQQFHALMQWVRDEFMRKNGFIDDIYFCPHHPKHARGNYLKVCSCRKPEPGMFKQAGLRHGIDMKESIMVGDKESDLDAARSAGVATLLAYKLQSVANDAHYISSLSQVENWLMCNEEIT